MKESFFAALAAIIFMGASCDSNTANSLGNTSQEQKNLAAFDSINHAFETGDVSGIDSVVSDDFVDHTERGDIKGRDSLKAMITVMHEKMSDMSIELKNAAANGDYVFGWMHYGGSSDGSMGIPKGAIDMTAVELVKFSDGKAVEHWAFMQPQDMMKMMGQPGAMDSTMNR